MAMIFGLAIVPVMLGAGVSLDMARAMIVRTRLTRRSMPQAWPSVARRPVAIGDADDGAAIFQQHDRPDGIRHTRLAHVDKAAKPSRFRPMPMPTTLMRLAGMNTLCYATSQITFGQTSARCAGCSTTPDR